MKVITSRHHPLVAAYRQLARGRGGDEHILLDGPHLVQEAWRAHLRLENAAIGSSFAATSEGRVLAASLAAGGTELIEVSDAVLEAMSPVSAPAGIVASAQRPTWSLADVLRPAPALVVIALDVQDPGNVGAIARAAEAGGATGLVLSGVSADPFGWKALRGSMGSLLRLPTVVAAGWPDAVAAARQAHARIVATTPQGGGGLDEVDARGPIAFLLGGEGPGLPDAAIAAADARVSIPMCRPVESLNVAVAAALLVYEAARQRGYAGCGNGAQEETTP